MLVYFFACLLNCLLDGFVGLLDWLFVLLVCACLSVCSYGVLFACLFGMTCFALFCYGVLRLCV